MTVTTLEVGKTYVPKGFRKGSRTRYSGGIRKVRDGTDIGVGELISIVGQIDPGTTEYEAEFRFFDSNGFRYTQDGSKRAGHPTLLPPKDNFPGVDREAIFNDLYEVSNRFRINLSECENNPKYQSIQKDDFCLRVGEVYVNRMGFLVLIDSFSPSENKTEWMFSSSYYQHGVRVPYTSKGRFAQPNTLRNMKDLVYQRM